MAYIKNGWIVIKKGSTELVLDELDEDAVEVEAETDKASVRMTTKNKPIYSITPEVAYRLTVAIPPKRAIAEKVINFQNLLKKEDYPDLEFDTYEKIDGAIKKTSYVDANWVQDLNFDSIMQADAPTGNFQILGTRVGEVFS